MELRVESEMSACSSNDLVGDEPSKQIVDDSKAEMNSCDDSALQEDTTVKGKNHGSRRHSLESSFVLGGDCRTSVLIKKQMSEIDKEINRRIQNKNIRKVCTFSIQKWINLFKLIRERNYLTFNFLKLLVFSSFDFEFLMFFFPIS